MIGDVIIQAAPAQGGAGHQLLAMILFGMAQVSASYLLAFAVTRRRQGG